MTERALATLGDYLVKHNLRLATAESCTGGLLAATFTSEAGCSAWFEGGFVTYRSSAKTRMLGLGAGFLRRENPVSETTARAMVTRTIERSGVDVAVATTGLAGPDGDGTAVAIGTLWIAWYCPGASPVSAERFEIHGGRSAFRDAAVAYAIEGLLERLGLA